MASFISVGPVKEVPNWLLPFTRSDEKLIVWYDTQIKWSPVLPSIGQKDNAIVVGNGLFVKITYEINPVMFEPDRELKAAYVYVDNISNNWKPTTTNWKVVPINTLLNLFNNSIQLGRGNGAWQKDYLMWEAIRKEAPSAILELFIQAGLPGKKLLPFQEAILEQFKRRIALDELAKTPEYAQQYEPPRREPILDKQISEIPTSAPIASGQFSTMMVSSAFNISDISSGRLASWNGPWPRELSSPTMDRIRAEEQQNMMVNTRPTPPENPAVGNVWTDTNTGKIRIWTGTDWIEITPITEEQSKAKVPDWLIPPKPEMPKIGRKIMDETT